MKPRTRVVPLFIGILGLALSSCGEHTQGSAGAIEMALIAKTDQGEPLPGVSWAASGQALGQSGAEGTFLRSLDGPEGRVVALTAVCPTGFQETPIVAQVHLKSSRDLAGRPEPTRYEVVCARQRVEVVLVVHASGAKGIPVRVDGRPSAVTDELGLAHLYLPSPRTNQRIDVSLDTSELPHLRPSNPSRSYELRSRDTILVFEQEFSSKASGRQRKQVIRARVPERID